MKAKNMYDPHYKFGMKLSDLMNHLVGIGALESYELGKSPYGKFTQNPSIVLREVFYDKETDDFENGDDLHELENCEPFSFTPDMDELENQKLYPE